MLAMEVELGGWGAGDSTCQATPSCEDLGPEYAGSHGTECTASPSVRPNSLSFLLRVCPFGRGDSINACGFNCTWAA